MLPSLLLARFIITSLTLFIHEQESYNPQNLVHDLVQSHTLHLLGDKMNKEKNTAFEELILIHEVSFRLKTGSEWKTKRPPKKAKHGSSG